MVFFLGDIVGHIVEEPDLIGLPLPKTLATALITSAVISCRLAKAKLTAQAMAAR